MAKDPFEQFAIPPEMRAFAERSVAQAREAFAGFVEAATKAVGQMQGSAQVAKAAPARLRRNRSPMPSRTWPRPSTSPRS